MTPIEPPVWPALRAYCRGLRAAEHAQDHALIVVSALAAEAQIDLALDALRVPQRERRAIIGERLAGTWEARLIHALRVRTFLLRGLRRISRVDRTPKR